MCMDVWFCKYKIQNTIISTDIEIYRYSYNKYNFYDINIHGMAVMSQQ